MVIQSRRVWISGQFLEAALKVEDGKIVQIYPYGTVKADVDYGTKRIVPGFIDVHTHGAYGFDTNDAEKDGLRNWMKRIPEEGVTAILPTTVTQMPDVLTAAVANVAEVVREGYEGAEILGIHFEDHIWIWSTRERSRRKRSPYRLWSSSRCTRKRPMA